jgi:tetratricopeptide (TPR) repeat protein
VGLLPLPAVSDDPEVVAHSECVQLFVDRAQAVHPDFQVTASNAAAVAELCRRLEGLPLAIELAAARAQVLTPAQILEQLQSRLDFLVSRRHDVEARHRSLRAAFDWSYQLLAPELQQFFAWLSVFHGGWSLEAAEGVTGAALALDDLMQLRECSLVLAESRGSEVRFRMPETLRVYAAERLQASPKEEGVSIRQRHAEWFDRFAAEQMAQLRTAEEPRALLRFEANLENVRAAVDWVQAAAHHELHARLALALGRFMQRRGVHREAVRWVQAGLSAMEQLGPEPTRLRGELLRERAGLYLDEFEWGEAQQWAMEARLVFEALEDLQGTADAHNLLGVAAKGERDFARARCCFAAALEQFAAVGDPTGIAIVHSNLGVLEYLAEPGSKEKTVHHWQESLRLHRQTGNQRGIAEVLNNLGAVAQEQGQLEEAWQYYTEALQIEQELRHALGVGRALSNLGEVAELKGEPARACRLFAAAEAIFAELGSSHRQYTAELFTRAASAAGYLAAEIEPLRRAVEGRSYDDLIGWALHDTVSASLP